MQQADFKGGTREVLLACGAAETSFANGDFCRRLPGGAPCLSSLHKPSPCSHAHDAQLLFRNRDGMHWLRACLSSCAVKQHAMINMCAQAHCCGCCRPGGVLVRGRTDVEHDLLGRHAGLLLWQRPGERSPGSASRANVRLFLFTPICQHDCPPPPSKSHSEQGA